MPSRISPAERLIVALDVAELSEALSLIGILRGTVSFFKVGLALFTRVGPQGIQRLKSEGISLFLDLKYHDIPAVVREAAASSSAMGADMITVHTSGGRAMMEAALEGARAGSGPGCVPPIVLGVTVLTSLDRSDLSELGYAGEVETRVKEWGALGRASGLDGLVASAREARALRRSLGSEFVLVTPGIRPFGGKAGDQKRVVTPADAVAAGSDYLVVGRPVIGAADPVLAARGIIDEIASASS